MDFSRSTTAPTILDLVNQISRGGAADWHALFLRCEVDAALREQVRQALVMIDPDLRWTADVWEGLCDHLDNVAQRLATGLHTVDTDDQDADPMLADFLAFMDRQMAATPELCSAFDPEQLALVERLVEGVDTDDHMEFPKAPPT